MATEKSVRRRRYSGEFKSQVLAECAVPGASVAKVAMAHGINDNLVHGWRKLARESNEARADRPDTEFVPVMLAQPAAPAAEPRDIEVELRRGAVTMRLTWPIAAAADFAAWARELLR